MAENLRFDLNVDTGSAVSDINRFFSAFDQGAARAESKLRSAFGQRLETEVQIEMKGGNVAAKEIKKIGTDSERLARTIKAVNGEFGRTPAQIKRSLSSLRALQGNTEKFSRVTGKVSRDWELVARRIDEAERELRGFYNAKPAGGVGTGGVSQMGQAFTAAGIKARLASEVIMAAGRLIQGAIGGMVERSRELSQLNVALQSFSRDAAQAEAIMTTAQMTGLKYGVSIQSVEKAWRRVGPAANAAGLSLQETDKLITSATARMAQMGLNTEQAGRYMEALAQVMGKGKLQGEELRQQFAELDGALRTQIEGFLQAEYGITDLDDAMQNGEVSAKMFAEGLIAISQDAVKNLAAGLGNLNDSFDRLNLEQRINNLNNVLTIAKQQWGDVFGPLAESLMRAGTLLAGFITTFPTRFPAIAKMITDNMAIVGQVVEMVIYGLVFGFEVLSQAFTKIIEDTSGWASVITKTLFPAQRIVEMVGKLNNAFGEGENTWWDNAVKNARETMGELGNMSTIYDSIKQKQAELNMGMEAGTEQQREQRAAINEQKDAYNDLVKSSKEAKDTEKEKKQLYEDQKKVVADLAASITARYDEEIQKAREVAETIKQNITTQKEDYKTLQDQVKQRYDAEMSRVKQVYDAKLRALDLERDALQSMGPKEKELQELEKKKLEDKIRAGGLDEEELLRAEARLERMERQEKLQALAVERKKVEAEKAQKLAQLEEAREKKLQNMKTEHEAIVKELKNQKKEQDDQIKKLQKQKSEIGLLKQGTEVYNGDLNEGVQELREQTSEMQSLKTDWDEATAKVRQYNQELANRPQPQQAPSGTDGERASGGPVSGGSTYTVNELGKEAFLSASGRLSNINAPAFGSWKAPSSGTVIPAHLASQLSIPTGGVNINSAASANASRAGAGGMSAMVRAIKGSMSGDTFNQSVTVQAANPVQAANNMMVEMTRLKRRRLG